MPGLLNCKSCRIAQSLQPPTEGNAMSSSSLHPVTPYGVAIQEAIALGNLPQMKSLLKQRDSSRKESKELSSAYEQLAQEVARLERR
jgi:Domain of unknown function (DUF1843)